MKICVICIIIMASCLYRQSSCCFFLKIYCSTNSVMIFIPCGCSPVFRVRCGERQLIRQLCARKVNGCHLEAVQVKIGQACSCVPDPENLCQLRRGKLWISEVRQHTSGGLWGLKVKTNLFQVDQGATEGDVVVGTAQQQSVWKASSTKLTWDKP